MSPTPRVAIVTGSNKGIGLAIVRALLQQYPSTPQGQTGDPLTIYLTARSSQRGQEALASLPSGSSPRILFHELDISSPGSISAFASHLRKTHPPGSIDILINNAGVALDGFNVDVVRETVGTNVYGTMAVCEAVLGGEERLMRDGGRVVNVCSTSGVLGGKYSDDVAREFRAAAEDEENGVERVEGLLGRFEAAVEERVGKEKEVGFPSAAYAVSKAAEIAYTKVLAKREHRLGKGVVVSACCPGYVNTDMTKGNGTKTVEQGADTPVMLALDHLKGKTGDFWKDRRVIEW